MPIGRLIAFFAFRPVLVKSVRFANSRIFRFLAGGLAATAIIPAFAATLEGLPGTLFSPSAQAMGHTNLSVSLGAYGHQDAGTLYNQDFFRHQNGIGGNPDTLSIQDLQSGVLRLNLALGLGKYVDVGLTVPYMGDFISDTEAKKLSGMGMGDPVLALKAAYNLAGQHVWDVAVLGNFSFPSKVDKGFLPKDPGYITWDTTISNPHYFTSNGIGFATQFLTTVDLSHLESKVPFRASLNVGIANSGAAQTESRLLAGGGLEWIPLPNLEFFGNAQTDTRISKVKSLASLNQEFAFAAVGFTASGDDGIFFSAALQKSLLNPAYHHYLKSDADANYAYDARAQPSWALALTIGWSGILVSGDQDGDGIPDKDDLCPNDPEDKDGFQDSDGCPDLDNDQDGIVDAFDKCPNQPEDKDGFEDADGCPDPDNDKDGILDSLDKCPNEPEDIDGFEDADGCPDLDNDKDGIPDALDKCPNEAEDKDGFQDADGCPDPDNDRDGILDQKDKCPNEPETFNGYQDDDGCPDTLPGAVPNAAPLERRSQLRVKFRGNTADFLPESFPVLDTLASQFLATKGAIVEIRGYWDDQGKELDVMRLSEARAVAIRKYLLAHNVPQDRVLARGMGGRDPIATNHTASGRNQNRRIEIVRMD